MTDTRTFRFENELLEELSAMAKKYGINENKLVARFLMRRVSIDPLIPTFEGISFTKQTFEAILGTTDMNSLEVLGWELGKTRFATAKKLYESNGGQLSFCRYVTDILGEHGGWFRIEGSGKNLHPGKMVLHHSFKLHWSVFLKSYLSGAYEVVSRNRLLVRITDEFVEIELPEDLKI